MFKQSLKCASKTHASGSVYATVCTRRTLSSTQVREQQIDVQAPILRMLADDLSYEPGAQKGHGLLQDQLHMSAYSRKVNWYCFVCNP